MVKFSCSRHLYRRCLDFLHQPPIPRRSWHPRLWIPQMRCVSSYGTGRRSTLKKSWQMSRFTSAVRATPGGYIVSQSDKVSLGRVRRVHTRKTQGDPAVLGTKTLSEFTKRHVGCWKIEGAVLPIFDWQTCNIGLRRFSLPFLENDVLGPFFGCILDCQGDHTAVCSSAGNRSTKTIRGRSR